MAELTLNGPKDVLASTQVIPDSQEHRSDAAKGRSGQGNGNRSNTITQEAVPGTASINRDDLQTQLHLLESRVKHYGFNFSINENSGEVVVEITNKDTGEVLRTIPPSSIVAIADGLDKDKGVVVDAES